MKMARDLVASRNGGGGGGGSSSGGSKGSGGKAVIELTEDNFKKEVMESDDLWLVEFFGGCSGSVFAKIFTSPTPLPSLALQINSPS